MIDPTTVSALFSGAIGGVIGGVLVLWCIHKPDQGNLLENDFNGRLNLHNEAILELNEMVQREVIDEQARHDVEYIKDILEQTHEVVDLKARRELREMRILLNQLPKIKKLVK